MPSASKIPRSNFAGAVLAGGKSSRMGRNKALLRVAGELLWQRQRRILRESGAHPVFIVQAPGQRALTRGVLRDTTRNAGPLAGLHAALAAMESTHLAVVAVDMPHLTSAWFLGLAKLCRPGVGVIARTADGYEPLAAIYPIEALATTAEHLAKGKLSLQLLTAALIHRRQLRVLRLTAAERQPLANWNTPADLSDRSSL